MKYRIYSMLFLSLILTVTTNTAFASCDAQKEDKAHKHDKQLTEVNERGDRAMGFSHKKTTHHFRLLRDGGAIEVYVNDPQDTSSLEQVRKHLAQIARMFSEGDFAMTMAVHDQMPPGVAVMKRVREAVRYVFEETEKGGRVLISTGDPQALRAVHEFLRFQIKDHQTGDSLEVNDP